MMTPARAKEIIQQARDRAVHGPWADQLDKVMTVAERLDVTLVWCRMPGYTNFVDALYRIESDRIPPPFKIGDTVRVTISYRNVALPPGEPGNMYPSFDSIGYEFTIGRIVETPDGIPNLYSAGGFGPIPLTCVEMVG